MKTAWLAYRMRRSCTDKVKFTRESRAKSKAHHLKLSVYKCLFCDGWHLTSKKKGKR